MIRTFFAVLILVSFMNSPMAADKTATENGAAIPNPQISRITAEELKKLIDEKSDIVIVDTRDSLSYDYGHIPGAVNIYYDPNGDPMNREMTLVALPADKLIVLYCP